MDVSTEQHSSKWSTAVVMSVVGVLFGALAVATGNRPEWWAAAAINFLGALDSLLRHHVPCGSAD